MGIIRVFMLLFLVFLVLAGQPVFADSAGLAQTNRVDSLQNAEPIDFEALEGTLVGFGTQVYNFLSAISLTLLIIAVSAGFLLIFIGAMFSTILLKAGIGTIVIGILAFMAIQFMPDIIASLTSITVQ